MFLNGLIFLENGKNLLLKDQGECLIFDTKIYNGKNIDVACGNFQVYVTKDFEDGERIVGVVEWFLKFLVLL